ncbi:MotA/TolQ/ExbB proton channel family protein [Treponema rectale]|uniref:Biopolymer transport protein ExbB n=1 Tax=Treponema rectale TaxID=744512 RepID=A0A840SCG2_9SPIR|nr:MotA/TolQ/ExbB proton channel family protein [Treponema rectale]MBB5217858.1 biopolymer transport protein ExbB [Treponema rectale]QOS40418.1 MotA/TolQ/ExbB proton channel family protein [Treponema rectale]
MESGFSLIELFKLGGPFMWVLLAFSVATIAIIIERSIYLAWHNCKVSPFTDKIKSLLKNGNKAEAERYLASCTHRQTIASILLALLKSSVYGENRMERAAETEAQERLRRMESGFNYLTALSSLAPLTGFLGTVSGMIGAFQSIAMATDVNAQLVAGGIYEALITTVFGLIIAIVALVAYNLLIQRVDTFSAETSKAINDLSAVLLDENKIA